MTRAPRPRRLFFALWPDDAQRATLSSAVAPGLRGLAGRPVPRHNLHVTLLYLGLTAEGTRRRIEAAARTAGELEGECALLLDHLGHWARPRVVWSAPQGLAPALRELVDRLRARVLEVGTSVETRPYSPHVTLLRKARRGPRSSEHEPVRWRFERFHLVESVAGDGGVRYDPLADWAIGPGTTLSRAEDPASAL